LRLHDVMVCARVLEQRLIALVRSGESYFWIGGPGEESFSAPLGLQLHVGEGPAYDYLHAHYRSSAILLAMGAQPIDFFRQARTAITDPWSRGRNFVNHYAIRRWNVVPVSSTVETQYSIAPGTAWMQKRFGGSGITVVNGGDAGAAEGDFESCLIWSSRPGNELPVLIILMHNGFGISTPAHSQWATKDLSQRAAPYGIRHRCIDGNDVELSWHALAEAMDYVRTERRPYCLQANVARLHGHSSSSGALRVDDRDGLTEYETTLIREGLLSRPEAERRWEQWRDHMRDAVEQARQEPLPEGSDALTHVFREPTT
jgi:2-oxoisovalerate dehydrogenase E1 component alpha subunit